MLILAQMHTSFYNFHYLQKHKVEGYAHEWTKQIKKTWTIFQMGSLGQFAAILWCSNHIFAFSSHPKATFYISYSSFSMHLILLLSNQSGCKNCPHFLKHVDSCKCTQRQLRWFKWPQDVVSMSIMDTSYNI